jgi:hypothetical protein
MLFRNWLDEGYYEEDSWGGLTRIEDPQDIRRAQKNGKLYHHDGYCMTKSSDDENLNIQEDENTEG